MNVSPFRHKRVNKKAYRVGKPLTCFIQNTQNTTGLPVQASMMMMDVYKLFHNRRQK